MDALVQDDLIYSLPPDRGEGPKGVLPVGSGRRSVTRRRTGTGEQQSGQRPQQKSQQVFTKR